MTTTTPMGVDDAPVAETPKVSRWNTPWLNSKLITGLIMVLFILLMSVYGPIIWDVNLARVASSPLNLPPPWAPGYRDQVVDPLIPNDSSAAPTSSPATPATETAPDSSTGSTGASSGALTGVNPFKQQEEAPEAPSTDSSAGSGALTGVNPFQQQEEEPAGDSSGGALTGVNPFANQADEESDSEAEATAAPSSAAATPVRALRGSRFGTPTWEHPLGTESNGRDMFAVLLVGAPRSLWIGIVAAGIGMFVGIILGFTAGFMGGWVDTVIRVISDSVITIPSLAVLIVISAFVSFNNITYMALMLALFAWPGPTRLIRSQVLSMREQGYVRMARLSGASVFSIMFGEMMPNLLPYLAASFTGNVSGAILAATGLEVLGLGPTRIPTLGITIFYAIRAAAILRGMWWWWGTPIVALIIIFSGLFIMTVGLDEIANPRLRGAKPQ